MIRKGKFDWYSPESMMSEETRGIFNKLPQLKELPHLPTYIMELQQLIQNDNTSSRQLAEVAKKAPILATKILTIANNQINVAGTKIESLEHAISYVGINAMRDIILLAALNTMKFQTKHFNADQFWEESFLVGKISEYLAKKFTPELMADEAYIAGTLCNIGKVVMAICTPEEADKIASDISNVKILGSWSQAETRNSFPSHTVLGEIGAVFWGLPEYVLDSISGHHTAPDSMVQANYQIKDIVTLANQLAHWVLLEPTRMDEELLNQLYEKFGLSSQDADALVEELMPLKSAA